MLSARRDHQAVPGATSAVGRAAAVINVLRSSAQPLTLTEIGHRSGLAKSTTHRLLNTLTASGVVLKQGAAYSLGVADAPTATQDRDARLRRMLAPCLSELYVSVRKTVGLAVLNGLQVVYLERVHAPASPWTTIDETRSAPALATAGGRLLLAYRPDAATLPELAESPRLTAELARIRQARFAVSESDVTRRRVCIAVPILGADATPCAAFTVTGVAADLNVPRTLHAMWTFATLATESLVRGRPIDAECRC